MTDYSDSNKPFFDNYDLKESNVEELKLGEIYPIYGMITEILEEDLENSSVVVKLLPDMVLNLHIDSQDKLNLIRDRAFEPGIFMTKITEKSNLNGTRSVLDFDTLEVVEEITSEDASNLVGHCKTIVFGKKQTEGVN